MLYVIMKDKRIFTVMCDGVEIYQFQQELQIVG